jgi:putative sigma-54 modulation protein
MEPSQRLTDYGLDKLSKLEKYLDSVLDADITFSVEKFRHRTVVVLSSDGLKIKAEQESEDMYSSIDMVVDKLEKQVKRHREKAKGHLKGAIPKEQFGFRAPLPASPGNGADHDAAEPPLERSHRSLDLPLATMAKDQAMERFTVGELPFSLYIDKADGALRLLRYTGGGLIEQVTFHRQAD